jgi:putative ABC transport system ATP-binding protein
MTERTASTMQELSAAPVKLLEIEGLVQHLRDPERPEEFVVHAEANITIHAGDFVTLLGPSGCGKTTLLTVLGLLRAPTNPRQLKKFSIWGEHDTKLHEFDLKALWGSSRERPIQELRRKYIGFALQSGELLPALTVRENIAAPLFLNGITGKHCWRRVDELVTSFGLRKQPAVSADSIDGSSPQPENSRQYDLSNARVNKLSGGEYQRVSLARAIAHHPRLIFVDEPTAALNREMARGALTELQSLLRKDSRPAAVIMITHDEELSQEFADVTIRMAPVKGRAAGELVDIVRKPPMAVNGIAKSMAGV